MIHTCSDSVLRAVNWLTDHLEKERDMWNLTHSAKFCALSAVGSPIVEEYVALASQECFWDESRLPEEHYLADFFVEGHSLFYSLAQLGLAGHAQFRKYFDEWVLSKQTIKGNVWTIPSSETLYALAIAMPNTSATELAVSFLLNNWQEFDDTSQLALGMLALQELDFFGHKPALEAINQWC